MDGSGVGLVGAPTLLGPILDGWFWVGAPIDLLDGWFRCGLGRGSYVVQDLS